MIRKIERVKNDKIKHEQTKCRESRELTEEHESKLNKIFRERESLQLELALLLGKNKKEHKEQKNRLKQEREKEDFFHELQLKQFEKNFKTNKYQESKRKRINQTLEF